MVVDQPTKKKYDIDSTQRQTDTNYLTERRMRCYPKKRLPHVLKGAAPAWLGRRRKKKDLGLVHTNSRLL